MPADIEYKGVQAFRHGHAHFGLQNAKNPEQMKAVSQNLMHKLTAITDELYLRMNAGDTNKIITTLGLDITSKKTAAAVTIPDNLPIKRNNSAEMRLKLQTPEKLIIVSQMTFNY